jgi:hypothetical protein
VDWHRTAVSAVVLTVALSFLWSVSLIKALPAHAEAPGTPIESGPETPSVDSTTGLGDKLSADPSAKVRIATQNDGSNSAIVRISVFNSESDNTIFAGGAPVFDIKSGQSISQTVLVPLEANLANIYASKTTDVRIELLAAFQGSDALPGSFRATLPDVRVDSSIGLGFAELRQSPQNVNVLGKGGIPAQNVRAVFISGMFEASAPTTLNIGGISLKVSGNFAFSTVVVPDEKGNVSFSADDGSVKAKIWTRGYAVGSKMGDNSANLGGSFVPKSEKVLDGDAVDEQKHALHINAQSDTTFSLILASAKATEAYELTTLDIGSEHQEREQGAAIDTDLGALPQLLVAHPDSGGNVNAIVHQGAAEVEAWHVGDFLQSETPGGISLEKAPEIRIESPTAGEDYSFQEHGGVTISGTVQTGSLSLSRVEVTAVAGSVRGAATRGGEEITEKTANDQPAVQDDGSQTRVTIGNAEIRYLPDGGAHFEIFTAPPRDDDWTFEVTAFTRADTFKTASVTAHIQMPKKDDVVIAKNTYSIGNPDAPEGRNLDLRVIRLEEKAVLFERTDQLTPGMILTAGIMENAPSGFIRKVVAVDQVPDGTMATTDAALITDAILQLNYVDRQNVINYATQEDLLEYQQKIAAIDGITNVEVHKEDICEGDQGFEAAEQKIGGKNDQYEQSIDDTGTRVSTRKNGQEVDSEPMMKYAGNIDGIPENLPSPEEYDPDNPPEGLDVNNPVYDDSAELPQYVRSCGDATQKAQPLSDQKILENGTLFKPLESPVDSEVQKDQGSITHFCLNVTVGSVLWSKARDIVPEKSNASISFQIEGGFTYCTTIREQVYKENWIKVDLDLRWDFWNMRPWAEMGTAETKVTERTNEYSAYVFARVRFALSAAKGVDASAPRETPQGDRKLDDDDKEVLKLIKWKWTLMVVFVPVVLAFEFWFFARVEVDFTLAGGMKNVSMKVVRSGWALNTQTGKRNIGDDGESKTSENFFTGAFLRGRMSLRIMVGIDFLIYDCFVLRVAAGVILSFSIAVVFHKAIGTSRSIVSGEYSVDLFVFIMFAIAIQVPILHKPEFYSEWILPLFSLNLVKIRWGSPYYNALPGRADLDLRQDSTTPKNILPNQLYILAEDSGNDYAPVPIAPRSRNIPLSCMNVDEGWTNELSASSKIPDYCLSNPHKTTTPKYSEVNVDSAIEVFCPGFIANFPFFASPDNACLNEASPPAQVDYLSSHPYNIFEEIPDTTGEYFEKMVKVGVDADSGKGQYKLKGASIAYSPNLIDVPVSALKRALDNPSLNIRARAFLRNNVDAESMLPKRFEEAAQALIDDWMCKVKPPEADDTWTAEGCIEKWDGKEGWVLTDSNRKQGEGGIIQEEFGLNLANFPRNEVGLQNFKTQVLPKFGMVPPTREMRAHVLKSDEFGHLQVYFLQPKGYHLIPLGEYRDGYGQGEPRYSYENTAVKDFNINMWTHTSDGKVVTAGENWADHPEHLTDSLGTLGSAAIRLVHKSRNVTRGEAFREVSATDPILYKDGDIIEYQDSLEYPKYLCKNYATGEVISSFVDYCPANYGVAHYENEQTLEDVNITTAMSGSWGAPLASGTLIPVHKTFQQGNEDVQEYDTDTLQVGVSSWSSPIGQRDSATGTYQLEPGVAFTQTYQVKAIGSESVTSISDSATLDFKKKAEIRALDTPITTAFNAYGSASKAIASEASFKSVGLNLVPSTPTEGVSYQVFKEKATEPIVFSNDVTQGVAYSRQSVDLNGGESPADPALVVPSSGQIDFAYLEPGNYILKQYKPSALWELNKSYEQKFTIEASGTSKRLKGVQVDYKINLDTSVGITNTSREQNGNNRSFTSGDGAIPAKAGDVLEYKVSASLPKYDAKGYQLAQGPMYNPRLSIDYDKTKLELVDKQKNPRDAGDIVACQRLSWLAATAAKNYDALAKESSPEQFKFDEQVVYINPENESLHVNDYTGDYYLSESAPFFPSAQTYASHYGITDSGGCHSMASFISADAPQANIGSFIGGRLLEMDASKKASAFATLDGGGLNFFDSKASEIRSDLGPENNQSPFVNETTSLYIGVAKQFGGYEPPMFLPQFLSYGEGSVSVRPPAEECDFRYENALFEPHWGEPNDAGKCAEAKIPTSVVGAIKPGDSVEQTFRFRVKEDFENTFITSTITDFKDSSTSTDMLESSIKMEPHRTEIYNGEYGLRSVEQDSMPNKLVPGAEYELVSATADRTPIYLTASEGLYTGYSSQVVDPSFQFIRTPSCQQEFERWEKNERIGMRPTCEVDLDVSNILRADENGAIDIHYLEKGSYQLRRLQTPHGYQDQVQPIAVNAGYNLDPHMFVDSLLYTPKFETTAEIENVTRGTKDDSRSETISSPDGTTTTNDYAALNLKKGDALSIYEHLTYSAEDNSGIAYGVRIKADVPENVQLTGGGTIYVNGESHESKLATTSDGFVYAGTITPPDQVRWRPTPEQCAPNAADGQGFIAGQASGKPPYVLPHAGSYFMCYLDPGSTAQIVDFNSPQHAWSWQIQPGDDITVSLDATVLEDGVGDIKTSLSYRNNYFEDNFSEYDSSSQVYYGRLNLQAKAKYLPDMEDGAFYKPSGKFELVEGAKYAIYRVDAPDNPQESGQDEDSENDSDGEGLLAESAEPADAGGGSSPYSGVGKFFDPSEPGEENSEGGESDDAASKIDALDVLTITNKPHPEECNVPDFANAHQGECSLKPYSDTADEKGYVSTNELGELEVDYLEAGRYCAVEVEVPNNWKHTEENEACFTISDFRTNADHLSASVILDVDYDPNVMVKTEVRNLTRESTNGYDTPELSDAPWAHDVVAKGGDKLQMKYHVEIPEDENASYVWNLKSLVQLADGYTQDEDGNASDISLVPGFECESFALPLTEDLPKYLQPDGRLKMEPGAKFDVTCEGVAEDTNVVFMSLIKADNTKIAWMDSSIIYPSQARTRVVDDSGAPVNGSQVITPGNNSGIRFELLDGGALADHDNGEEGTSQAEAKVSGDLDWQVLDPSQISIDDLTKSLSSDVDFSNASYAKVDLSANLHDQALPYSPNLGEDGYLYPDANGDIGVYYLPQGNYVLHQVNTIPGYYYDDDARSFGVLDKSAVTSYHDVQLGDWVQHSLEPFSVLMALRTTPDDAYSTHKHVLHESETADIVTDFALPQHLNKGSLSQLALHMHAPHFLAEEQFRGHYAALEQFARDNLKVIYYAEDSGLRITHDAFLEEGEDYTVSWLDDIDQAHDEDLLFSVEFTPALVDKLVDSNAHIALNYQLEGAELYRDEESFEVHEQSVGEVNLKREDSNDIGLYGTRNPNTPTPDGPPPEDPNPTPDKGPDAPKPPKVSYSVSDDSEAIDQELEALSKELKKAHKDYGKLGEASTPDEVNNRVSIPLWLWSIFIAILLLLAALRIIQRALRRRARGASDGDIMEPEAGASFTVDAKESEKE